MKLLLLVLIFLIGFPFLLLAEDLTITTYYPSPYGSYNELTSNRLSINITDAASNDGVIRFNPVDIASDGNEGEIYYDSSEHKFKYMNNTAGWKPLSGSGNVQSGWGYVCNVAGCPVVSISGIDYPSRTVNFTTSFSTPPKVVAIQTGCKSSTAPSSPADCNALICSGNQLANAPMITDVTTTGFTFINYVYAAGQYVGFYWIASE